MALVQDALYCHPVCHLEVEGIDFHLEVCGGTPRESLSLGVVGRNLLGSVAPSNMCDELEQKEQRKI